MPLFILHTTPLGAHAEELWIDGKPACPDCGELLNAHGACPYVDRAHASYYQRQRKRCGHREHSAPGMERTA